MRENGVGFFLRMLYLKQLAMHPILTVLVCSIGAQATSFSRIVVDDLPITVYDHNLTNPILLNVPGNGGWNYLTPKLGQRLGLFRLFTVATYEMRGMPDGTTPPDSWDVHVDDVLAITHALLRKYHVSSICILGYSTGTYVAMRAATEVPRSFRAVVTMGLLPNLKTDAAAARIEDSLWNNLFVPSWLSKAVSYADYTPWLIQMGSANEMKANIGLSTIMSIPPQDIGPIDPIGNSRLSQSMNALHMPDIHFEDVAIVCPLYVIQGDSDTMGVKSIIQSQIGALRATKVEFFWIEGAGHLLHLTHPEGVACAFSSLRGAL
jgi:pimeloyl-ACP methyl ester carboxylesterase